jgi:hypothetical protein
LKIKKIGGAKGEELSSQFHLRVMFKENSRRRGFSLESFVILLFCIDLATSVYGDPNRSETAEASPGADHAPASDIGPSPKSGDGLKFTVGDKGLTSLSYNGQSFFSSPSNGELRPGTAIFSTGSPKLAVNTTPIASLDQAAQKVTLTYDWGSVSSTYTKEGDRLLMKIHVGNTSDKVLAELPVVVTELNFPASPKGTTLEAGMFGFGFNGTMQPLDQSPLVADPRSVAPVIRIDYGTGALNFCSDNFLATISVPYTSNPPAKTKYPFIASFNDVKPGSSKTATISLRFGPTGATVSDLSNDVIARYAKTYPFALKWKDRRPIGMMFLASSGTKVPSNPRRWIMNTGKIDVSTNEGRASFREALLDWADRSIKVLKDANAQGMITWDPEGQEFSQSVYYGDPRLTPVLAPEMEFKGEGITSAIDEYFEKFRRAGLKVGVCLRPQQITIVDGKPVQGAADNEHAADILKDKLAYAKKRWGCTLFYVDSTVTAQHGSLDPDVFQSVAEAYPDVLLMPENESMRYFAYTAPLNSYVHHRITSTPVGVRAVYPNAFSVLMAPDGDKPEDHDALVAAVGRGDVLLFNCWYHNPGVDKIKKIYEEAAR